MIYLGIAFVLLILFLWHEEPEEKRKRMSRGRMDTLWSPLLDHKTWDERKPGPKGIHSLSNNVRWYATGKESRPEDDEKLNRRFLRVKVPGPRLGE